MSNPLKMPPAEARQEPRRSFWKTEFERIFLQSAAAIRRPAK